jgi:hypothetical protein
VSLNIVTAPARHAFRLAEQVGALTGVAGLATRARRFVDGLTAYEVSDEERAQTQRFMQDRFDEAGPPV